LFRTNESAAASRRCLRGSMLRLLSMTRPRLTGMSSCLKTVILCSFRSSKIRKFSFFKLPTGRSCWSVTFTCTSLRSTFTLSLNVESCPARIDAKRTEQRTKVFIFIIFIELRRIVAEGLAPRITFLVLAPFQNGRRNRQQNDDSDDQMKITVNAGDATTESISQE